MFWTVLCDGKFQNGPNVQGKFNSLFVDKVYKVTVFRSCGGGVKERRVECKQIMAQEHKVERRPELCPSVKPPSRKPCNTKACAPEDQRPPIASSNSTYIQHDPKKNKVRQKLKIYQIVIDICVLFRLL